MTVEVRRAGERFRTSNEWLESRHSFSFGPHYDPANLGFGLLVAHNDDIVAPGTGFDTHPHRDLEIVTWVLSGSLVHADSTGNGGEIHPGLAQRMSAGSGIQHSEMNDSYTPVHFVQMWVRPHEPGLPPSYAQHDVTADLATGQLVLVASGVPGGHAAVSLNQPAAEFHAAHLRPGSSVTLPAAPYLHAFVATGTATLESTSTSSAAPDDAGSAAPDDTGFLSAGDTARITSSDGRRVTAGPDGAELLIWTFAIPRPATS